jgi:hypothetical protein
MPKTVALQHPAGKLAAVLADKGYKVLDLQEAVRFRAHVDAILYAGRRPATGPAGHEAPEAADMSIGYSHYGAADDALPGAVVLNVAGLSPEAAAAELEVRLRHHTWRT